MASVKNILLSSLLGGVSGGSGQYLAEKQNQREYALKKLAAEQPPSDIQSMQALYPDWGIDKTRDQQRYYDSKTAGAGVKINVDQSGNVTKTDITPTQTPVNDKVFESYKKQIRSEPGGNKKTESEVNIEANKRMKKASKGSSGFDIDLSAPVEQ